VIRYFQILDSKFGSVSGCQFRNHCNASGRIEFGAGRERLYPADTIGTLLLHEFSIKVSAIFWRP